MIPALTKGQTLMLEKAYLTPSHAASFSSPQRLRAGLLSKKHPSKRGATVRVPSLKQIQHWLLEKRAYTLHRPSRKKYKMKKVIVGGVNIQLQLDLIDMQPWAHQNDNFRYILLAIDCFSRFGYAYPLKTKHGLNVAEGIETIINEAERRIDRKIKTLQTDEGTEFYNRHVKNLLEARHVSLFSTKSPTKAQMVERLIRTLRSRQERFNTLHGKRRWVESFPKLIASYNKTIHSSLPLKMTPADVNLNNEKSVWEHLYADEFTPTKNEKNLLRVGTPVRLSKRKRTFEKAYYQNYTDEIFFIEHVSTGTKPTTYRVADVEGDLLEGIFYRQELTPVRIGSESTYAVENVLKETIRKDGKKYLFVKWRGYPDSQNSWIRADQFVSIQNAL